MSLPRLPWVALRASWDSLRRPGKSGYDLKLKYFSRCLRFFGNRTPFPGAPSRQDFLYAWQRAHEEAWDVSVYHRHATSDPLQFAQGML